MTQSSLEEVVIAVIEGARYLVKSLERSEPDSPGAVDYRSRLGEMRRTAEERLRQVQALRPSRAREHLIGLLTLALSEIPDNGVDQLLSRVITSRRSSEG